MTHLTANDIIPAWESFARTIIPTLDIPAGSWAKIRFRPNGVVLHLLNAAGEHINTPNALMELLRGATTEAGQTMRKYLPVGEASMLASCDGEKGIIATINNKADEEHPEEDSLIYTSWGPKGSGFYLGQHNPDAKKEKKISGETGIVNMADMPHDSIVYNTLDNRLYVDAIKLHGESAANAMRTLNMGGHLVRQYPDHTLLIHEDNGMIGYYKK